MGGYLNKIGLQGHPLDTDVRVLKEPRTVPYNRIGSLKRIRTVSVPYRPYLTAGKPVIALNFPPISPSAF